MLDPARIVPTLAVVPLRHRIRRVARAALRRAVEPAVRERLDLARQTAALRSEIAALEARIQQISDLVADAGARSEDG